jgi:hypothetical protein
MMVDVDSKEKMVWYPVLPAMCDLHNIIEAVRKK